MKISPLVDWKGKPVRNQPISDSSLRIQKIPSIPQSHIALFISSVFFRIEHRSPSFNIPHRWQIQEFIYKTKNKKTTPKPTPFYHAAIARKNSLAPGIYSNIQIYNPILFLYYFSFGDDNAAVLCSLSNKRSRSTKNSTELQPNPISHKGRHSISNKVYVWKQAIYWEDAYIVEVGVTTSGYYYVFVTQQEKRDGQMGVQF